MNRTCIVTIDRWPMGRFRSGVPKSVSMSIIISKPQHVLNIGQLVIVLPLHDFYQIVPGQINVGPWISMSPFFVLGFRNDCLTGGESHDKA